MDDNTHIVEKLKKLLVLSKSSTQAEADNALEKARAISVKYDIDLALVSIDAVEKEIIIDSEHVLGKRKCVCQRWVTRILQEFYKVEIVYSGNRYCGKKIVFLGKKSDVEFALYVQSFLMEHMMRSWHYYARAHVVGVRYRATFMQGFYKGLSDKLTEVSKKAAAEVFSSIPDALRRDAEDRYGMVLVTDKAEVKNYMMKKFPSLRMTHATPINNFGGDAANHGYRSGSVTSIARPLGNRLALN